MVELKKDQKTVHTYASGRLSDEDYEKIGAFLEDAINIHGTVNCFFEMREFEGWTPNGLWNDAKLSLGNRKEIDRVAILGSEKWQKWFTDIIQFLAKTEVRYFDPSERHQAEAWL